MSDEGRDRFEIPKDMRAMAEASFEQARKTFEKFVASAQAAAGSIEERNATARAGAKDISSKAIAYAEKNVQASLDYAQSLLKAKDLTEVMRLHSEYVQGRCARWRSRPAKWVRSSPRPPWTPPSRKPDLRASLSGSLRLLDRRAHPGRVKYAATHHKLRCVAQI